MYDPASAHADEIRTLVDAAPPLTPETLAALRRTLAPNHSQPARAEWVYFIQCGEHVKIGTSVEPAKRLKALQTASPAPMTLLATEPGGPDRESALHRQYHHLRVQGEWFRLDGALADHIRGLSDA